MKKQSEKDRILTIKQGNVLRNAVLFLETAKINYLDVEKYNQDLIQLLTVTQDLRTYFTHAFNEGK